MGSCAFSCLEVKNNSFALANLKERDEKGRYSNDFGPDFNVANTNSLGQCY